jgi:hypothetical protein
MIGAHIHKNEMRASKSSLFNKLNVPTIVTQSITPVYLNNPGYTTLVLT